MKILSINSGSQTLKYKLYNSSDFKEVEEGEIKDIGFGEVENHDEAIEKVIQDLKSYKDKIELIGHRYVNGGNFYGPLKMDKEKVGELEKFNHLAPLHNPANLSGIKAALKILPKSMNVAVFDTFYYKGLPYKAKTYAIKREVAKKYGYRRYGFHGTSHRYVVLKAAEILNKGLDKIKVISLHLGGGASITATKFGKAIDTSMGYTPLEGLVMMTRSGDIDPGIVIDLVRKGYSAQDIDNLLNKESGLFGLSANKGMLSILENLDDEEINKAYQVYIYRIKKYVGAYFAALNGCDAIVFTGSVGSGKAITRISVMEDMDYMEDIPVLAIKTDEELMIAKDAYNIFNGKEVT